MLPRCCATHHAVTNIIQQKKIPSKTTRVLQPNGSGRGSIHPILFFFSRHLSHRMGRAGESPWEVQAHDGAPRVVTAGSHTLSAAIGEELGLLTPTSRQSCSASCPTEPSKRGVFRNNIPTCLCHERSWKECTEPHDKRGPSGCTEHRNSSFLINSEQSWLSKVFPIVLLNFSSHRTAVRRRLLCCCK